MSGCYDNVKVLYSLWFHFEMGWCFINGKKNHPGACIGLFNSICNFVFEFEFESFSLSLYITTTTMSTNDVVSGLLFLLYLSMYHHKSTNGEHSMHNYFNLHKPWDTTFPFGVWAKGR